MVKVLAVNSIPLDHPWLFSGILNDSLFLFIKNSGKCSVFYDCNNIYYLID
jgi:hypothetical protein